MPKKKVGRPRMFETPEQMEPLIEKYFADCDAASRPYTMPGLANALGFIDRKSPAEYARKFPEFTATIKRARLRIEEQRNIQLITESNVAGKIFDLLNNFDWKDKQELQHSVEQRRPIVKVVYKNRLDVPAKDADGDTE